MKVLHVITALGVGGAERMLLKLLEARALSNVEQSVVAMLPSGPMAESMRAAGANVDRLNFLGGVPVLGGVLRLAALTRRLRPDLVQGWMYHGNLGATVAQVAAGRKAVLVWGIRQSLGTLQGENRFARVAIRLNKVWSTRPDRVLFNSQVSMQQHQAFGFDMRRASYLPNGFDTEAYAPDLKARTSARAQWGVSDDSVVFGLLARYHPAKDHAGFLRAAQQVMVVRPKAHFVMAGTGVDRTNSVLARVIAETGLSEHVTLLGERKDVAAVLAGLDVCVSASARIEAFSNSIGEAMSCALPCIVTDIGDSATVVGSTGHVVRAQDSPAQTAAMVAMMDLGAEGRANLGRQARERIESKFSIESVAQAYGALYRDLVAARTRQV